MKKLLLSAAVLSILALASLAAAETIQKGPVRIAFAGAISPNKLPRQGMAPVTVSVGTEISAVKGKPLAQLQKIEIAINSHGRLDATGLPKCEVTDIQPATTAKALEECKPSLVGEGSFSSEVSLSKQAAFPSEGKLYAFNGTYKGKPAILAHVYGSEPVPTSFTLPFVIAKAKGTFGTKLTATIPASEDNLVTAIEMKLQRTYTYKGKRRSYASAGCPAPKGFPGASFPFAKASYAFVGGKKLRLDLDAELHRALAASCCTVSTIEGMEGSERDEVQRLPAGTHGIPADVVARNQRERLVAAVAEACAEKGYAETSVADLSHRAGVSTATFYKLFAGKQECALEAHRELLARLLEEVDRACAAAGDLDGKVRAAAGTVLELFSADAPTARLLTVEVLALGPAGSERHDAAIEAFAARLRAARGPGAEPVQAAADWARLAGVSALIGRQVMAGEAADLPRLEREAVALVLADG